MRHNRDVKRFSRTGGHLRCMMSNMTNSLIMEGRIKTTTPKAKALRRYAEKMITLGKKSTLASRRRAMAFMRNKSAVTRLFTEVAPGYEQRKGGYTRILKVGIRAGDSAPMSIIELVETEVKPEAAKKRTTGVRARVKSAVSKKTAPAKKAAAPKKPASEKKAATEKKAAPAKKESTGSTTKPKAPAVKNAAGATKKSSDKAVKPAASKKEAAKPAAKKKAD